MLSGLLVNNRIICRPSKKKYTTAHVCPWLSSIFVILEVVSSGLEGISPLPLPVALLPPLGPGEAAPCCPVGLVVLITVGIVLGNRERSVWKNLSELREEERLQTAACLGHLRVGLQGHRETSQLLLDATD